MRTPKNSVILCPDIIGLISWHRYNNKTLPISQVSRYKGTEFSVVCIFQKSKFSRNKVIVTYTKYKHSLQFVFMRAVLLMLLLEKVTYKLFTLLLKCRDVGRFSNPGGQAVTILVDWYRVNSSMRNRELCCTILLNLHHRDF